MTVIIFDSPDGTGKTEIAKALSDRICVPYFKMTTEHENWRKGTFKEALRFDQTYILEFLKQTKHCAIIDRAYPSEWVYSKVFGRETDVDVLKKVDEGFSSLRTTIVIPLRHDYSSNRDDEIIPKDKLIELHNSYKHFIEWTKCDVVAVYVDSLNNDLKKELDAITNGLQKMQGGSKTVVTIG